VRKAAPAAGGDADEVLREVGYSAEEIGTLRRDGVVGGAPAGAPA
jgi:crotonobetainyl-CoA:carnitine CoA-transferase CaiB-like acyl-CoA transferase